MGNWDLIVERKIQEAMEEGAFDNLSGRGKPLPQDENPHEDPTMRMSYRLLRNNGFSLPWIEEARDLDSALESARAKLMGSRAMLHATHSRHPHKSRQTHWEDAVDQFRNSVAKINRQIQTYNLTTPSPSFHRLPINPDRELKRILEQSTPSVEANIETGRALMELPDRQKWGIWRLLSAGCRHLRLMRPRATKGSVAALVCALIILAPAARAYATRTSIEPGPAAASLIILPDLPVAVAPNQPEVLADSTRGIINALCEVTLNILGCGFMPSNGKITCDTNGDGAPELTIPLTNITLVNRNLIQALIPALSPQLPGTPFPLACCGGLATLTLSRTISAGDDNIFGEFTQSITCPIELGERAPVVVSVTPSGGNCAIGQNLLISGSCFLRGDGTPNVTSVFAVDRDNPNTVIQSSASAILGPNLIDAFFTFGSANAGKTFLIFASGPNGTSRNLTALPAGAPAGCPLGNEQGIQVTFTCQSSATPPPPPPPPQAPSELNLVVSCSIERSSSGSTSLVLHHQWNQRRRGHPDRRSEGEENEVYGPGGAAQHVRKGRPEGKGLPRPSRVGACHLSRRQTNRSVHVRSEL